MNRHLKNFAVALAICSWGSAPKRFYAICNSTQGDNGGVNFLAGWHCRSIGGVKRQREDKSGCGQD